MIRRSPFTLLEMLAAVTILAIVGAVSGMALTSFARSWEKGRQVGDRLARYQTIDRFAESVLRNLIPFRWPVEELESDQELLFRGNGEDLYGVSQKRVYGKTDYPFLFFRLYLEQQELKCDYSSTPLIPDETVTGQQVDTETLADGVKSLTFLFADYNGSEIEWTEDWDEDRDALPLAIQITVEFTDGTRQCWLRRTAGSAAGSVWGDRLDPEES